MGTWEYWAPHSSSHCDRVHEMRVPDVGRPKYISGFSQNCVPCVLLDFSHCGLDSRDPEELM